MSIIIGLIENEKIYMGCDTQLSCSSFGDKNNDTTMNKIIRKDDMLIGMSGYYRDINILTYRFHPPKDRQENTEEYIFVDFLDSMISVLRRHERITIKDGVSSIEDSNFLIAYRNRLFTIESDLSVSESKGNFQCVGCGYRYAVGALEAIKDLQINPEDKLKKALEITSKYDLYCSAPFIIEII